MAHAEHVSVLHTEVVLLNSEATVDTVVVGWLACWLVDWPVLVLMIRDVFWF